MDCQLVYALIPRQPLQAMVDQRALLKAKKRMRAAAHTMILEDQALEEPELRQQIDALAEELLNQKGAMLWGEK
jgi:hypothetical protein